MRAKSRLPRTAASEDTAAREVGLPKGAQSACHVSDARANQSNALTASVVAVGTGAALT